MRDCRLYGLKDAKADCFIFFNFNFNDAVAVRMFTDEVNRKDDNNILYAHPSDYSLYFLGEFDKFTGNFIDFENKPPVFLVNASSVVKQ